MIVRDIRSTLRLMRSQPLMAAAIVGGSAARVTAVAKSTASQPSSIAIVASLVLVLSTICAFTGGLSGSRDRSSL